MALDVRTAQTDLEVALKNAVLYALGRRLSAVPSVAALRAVTTRGESSSLRDDDELINVVVSGVVTAAYRWSSTSTAADNGTTVIKPTDARGGGRWLSWTSPLRFAPTVGGTSKYLHEILTGPLERVIVLDKDTDQDDMVNLLSGASPAVLIDARGDSPDPFTFAGNRWDTEFDFGLYVVAENLRDQRQAAQGSTISGDVTYGANGLDGLLQALLCGVQMFGVLDGVRNIVPGRGSNWVSKMAQRRVIRSRDLKIQATVESPAASNDSGALEEVDAQATMTDLGDQTAYDGDNYVASGIDVALGAGLTKTVRAGSATIGGAAVTFAGELVTLAANSDTYRDLLPDGTMTYVAVGLFQAEPAVTATALRVGVTSTDGSGVIADRFIAERRTAYMNARTTPLDE